jgi:hypothetical protein
MQHFMWGALNLEEIIFSSNFDTMFREAYKIRKLTPYCIKIIFGTVNF